MAKATQAHSRHPSHVQQAAAKILALVNSSPRTPWPSEIETIIAKARLSDDCGDEAVAVAHATWRKLVIEAEDTLRAKDLVHGDPRLPAAEAISDAAFERLHAFEASIWERPARSLADLPLLADLLVYQLWPGYSMTEAFPGNDPHDLDALIEGGPFCQDDDGRTGVLLRAIRDLIGPPKALEAVLVAPDDAALVDVVRNALVRLDEAERHCVKLDNDDGAVQACKDRWRDLWAAQAQIPNPPRSPVHLLLHAEIAHHGADKDHDGKLSVDDTDCFEVTAARLIEACVAYFGARRHIVVRDL